MITTLLAASIILSQLSKNICAEACNVLTSEEQIQASCIASDYGHENSADMRELFDRVPVNEEECAKLLASQREDGSWEDIDYADTRRSGWDPQQHAIRIRRLAVYWTANGREDVLACIHKALGYWFSQGPTCRNWWYNEIGVPREMGPAYLILREEMTPEELEGAIASLSRSVRNFTGQNKVWVSGVKLIKGILEDDEALVREMHKAIASEIKVTDKEGLQEDNSFHQHGPQLQFGNYGLSYACSLSQWAWIFQGTEFEFTEEQMNILRNYVREGLRWVVWRGWFDMNACARQVFTNTQKGKALCAAKAASDLGISMKPFYGAKYYPRSDFGIFRAKKWYASIRMQSNRTKGFETTNSENMKGYFSADGALLVRRSGDEYNNISPCWEWKHIPGATTYDNGKPLWGVKGDDRVFPYNKADMVCGKVAKGMMAAAMDYKRDSLCARKFYVFWKGGIVCLGAGIDIQVPEWSVTTTVEQNLLEGAIVEGKDYVSHRGISYISLDGQKLNVWSGKRTGTWRYVGPFYSEDEVSMDIFEITLPHGTDVHGASYAYCVSPMGYSGKKASRIARRKIKVIENTADRQVVKIGRRTVSINWTNGEICL